ARQKVILLCGSCEAHEHRGDHAQRERDLWRRAGRRPFFVEDVLLDDAPVGTAVAPRPHAGAPAAAVEDLLPAHEVVFVHSPSQAHFGADVGRKLGFEESADFGAKGFFFGGVVEIHEGSHSIMTTTLPRAARAPSLAIASIPRCSGKRSVTAGLMRPSRYSAMSAATLAACCRGWRAVNSPQNTPMIWQLLSKVRLRGSFGIPAVKPTTR